MAGYWSSSFFANLWTETKSIKTQKKTEADISQIDRTSLVNKKFIIWSKIGNAGNPERARWVLLACSGSQSEHEIRSRNQPWLHHSVIQTFKPRLQAEMTSEYFKLGVRIWFFVQV